MIEIVDSDSKLSIKNYKELPDGSLLCWARLARTGILNYGDSSDFVSAETLYESDSINSLVGVPATWQHPKAFIRDLNSRNTLAKGVVLQEILKENVEDQDFLTAALLVHDAALKNNILSGKITQVSCGYEAERVAVSDSTDYQYEQKSRRYNHVAFCHQGRAGNAEVLIKDSVEPSIGSLVRLIVRHHNILSEISDDLTETSLKNYLVEKLTGKSASSYSIEVCDALLENLPAVTRAIAPAPQPESNGLTVEAAKKLYLEKVLRG